MGRQMISLIERKEQPMPWTQFLEIVLFFKSNNDFEKGAKAVAKMHVNIVEQVLLLESDMILHKKGRIKK